MNLYYFNIVKICNSNCLFCAADYEDRRSKYTVGNQYITAEQFQNIFKVHSVDIGDIVILNGGEPTLNCDLINMIKYCNQTGAGSYLFTNGRKFENFEFAQKIIDSGVDKITIPIYGHTPELHDNITRCIGSFRETVMGIRNLNILKKRHQFILELKILICMDNYSHIRSIADYLLRNFKFDILLISGLIPSDIAVKNKQVVPKELHRKAINDFFDFFAKSKRQVVLMLDGIPICHLDDKSRITYLLQRKLNSYKSYEMIENCYYVDVSTPYNISSSSEINNWNKPVCDKSECIYRSICRLNTLLNHTNFLKEWIL